MTVRAPMLANDVDSRQDFRLALSGLLVPTGLLTSRGGFVPDGGGTLDATGGMQMRLMWCRVWIQGGSAADQGAYPVTVSASETVTHDNGGATDRIDLIVVRVRDDAADGSGQYTATVEIVKGTSATTPPAVPTNAIAAWEVTVPAGRTAANGGLSAANITKDRRSYISALGGVTPSLSASDVAGLYPGQYRHRRDIDVLERYSGSSWAPVANPADQTAWSGYTPTWTASTTNPTLGNGTLNGKYKQIGKTVMVRVTFIVGSTTTFGAGAWHFALPTQAAAQHPGCGYAYDVSAGLYKPLSCYTPGSAITVVSDGGIVASTVPWTWASGDQLFLSVVYETS